MKQQHDIINEGRSKNIHISHLDMKIIDIWYSCRNQKNKKEGHERRQVSQENYIICPICGRKLLNNLKNIKDTLCNDIIENYSCICGYMKINVKF